MMEDLPIDTSHPALREYLALVRCVCTTFMIDAEFTDREGYQTAGTDASVAPHQHSNVDGLHVRTRPEPRHVHRSRTRWSGHSHLCRTNIRTIPVCNIAKAILDRRFHCGDLRRTSWILCAARTLSETGDQARHHSGMRIPFDARQLGHGILGHLMGTFHQAMLCIKPTRTNCRLKILQAFLLSTIFLGVLLGLLLYANVVLLIYHAPTGKRRVPRYAALQSNTQLT